MVRINVFDLVFNMNKYLLIIACVLLVGSSCKKSSGSSNQPPTGTDTAFFAKGADILVHEVIDVPAIEAALHRPIPGLDTSPARINALMTHMITEHSTPQEVGKPASQAGVRMVVLSHLIPGAPTEPDSGYVEGVKEFYSGPVFVGRDLMEF